VLLDVRTLLTMPAPVEPKPEPAASV